MEGMISSVNSIETSVFRQQFRPSHSETQRQIAEVDLFWWAFFQSPSSENFSPPSQGWVITAKFILHGPVTLATLDLIQADVLSWKPINGSGFSLSLGLVDEQRCSELRLLFYITQSERHRKEGLPVALKFIGINNS